MRVDDLGSVYRASRKSGPAAKGPCPRVKALLASFSSDTAESEKLRFVDHVASCPSCHQKFEAARGVLLEGVRWANEYQEIALSPQETASLRDRARVRIQELEQQRRQGTGREGFLARLFTPRVLRLASAAAFLIIGSIILISVLTVRNQPGEDIVRGEEAQGIRLESPRSESGEKPLAFRWRPYPRSLEYEVKLLDADLTPLWVSERTKDVSMSYPADRWAELAPGKTYYWKVIAHLPEGKSLESALQEFRLRAH